MSHAAMRAAGWELARYRKIHMFDITAPDGTPVSFLQQLLSGARINSGMDGKPGGWPQSTLKG